MLPTAMRLAKVAILDHVQRFSCFLQDLSIYISAAFAAAVDTGSWPDAYGACVHHVQHDHVTFCFLQMLCLYQAHSICKSMCSSAWRC